MKYIKKMWVAKCIYESKIFLLALIQYKTCGFSNSYDTKNTSIITVNNVMCHKYNF